ncbi:hypothetical protein [Luteolibacter sp. Populi]|uniref:hypothetical protein n=1 Tax=Luteolibacter sp. Populi TaxID=3230487 RepID=UPI0034657F54
MNADDADDFESGISLLIRQVLLFFAAAWFGSTLAAFSFVTGQAANAPGRFLPEDLWALTRGPEFLLTIWLLPNAVFLAIMVFRLTACSDSASHRSWTLLIGGEALFAMAGASGKLHGWIALPVAWAGCLGWILFTWATLYLLHQWQMRRWAGEMIALGAENAARRLEMDEEEAASEREPATLRPLG